MFNEASSLIFSFHCSSEKQFLINKKPTVLEERYKVTVDEREPIEIYDDILRKSGCIMRGNEVDYTRGGFRVLEDFRSGKMGKICLDLM